MPQRVGKTNGAQLVGRATHLAGVVAVLGILVLVSFVDGQSELWIVFTPVVLMFVCMAITNTFAHAVGSEPARFSATYSVPDVGRDRVLAATLADGLVACLLTILLGMVLLVALGIGEQMGPDMVPFTSKGVVDVFDEGWTPLVVFLAVFLLYRWVALGSWGYGLGGRWKRLRMRDHRGERPGWFRLLLRCTFDTVCVGLSLAAVAVLPEDRGVPAMASVMVLVVCVGTNEGRSLTHVVSGTRYEPHEPAGDLFEADPL